MNADCHNLVRRATKVIPTAKLTGYLHPCKHHIVTRADDLITTQDACQILDVTPSAVSRMVARGALKPALKTPGSRGAFLFDRGQVEELATASSEAE